MTPDQQQRAIERVCGWIIANPENDRADYRHWTPPNCVAKPNHIYGDRPPDYLNDLNAMHEAEKVLTPKHQPDKGESQWGEYLGWLGFSVEYNTREVYECVTATAAQRAKAFLRTLGLWTKTPTQPQ